MRMASTNSTPGDAGAPATAQPALDPTEPLEASTVVGLLSRYAADGYDTELMVTRDGLIRCLACQQEADPRDTDLDSMQRIEGASDPDDLQVIAALTCPNCGARGAVVVAYGPNASPEDADVLAALEDRRRPHDLSVSQPPE
jgi:hypothetical protein